MDANSSSAAWIAPEILVPWSSRVSFSSSVCGLPGRNCGCWRWRQLEAEDQLTFRKPLEKAIGPRASSDDSVRWLVFHLGVDKNLRVTPCDSPSEADLQRRLERHCAVFGFSSPESFHALQPTSLECRAWIEEIDEHREIEHWTHPEASGSANGLSLYDCFAGKLFEAVEIGEQQVSIAEMIGRYLDGRCQAFRSNPLGPQFGVSWCHLEVELLRRWNAERKPRGERPSKSYLLSDYVVSFSYVDPGTHELRFLEVPRFGGSVFEQRSTGPLEPSRPLVVGLQDRQPEAALTYADCLAPEHRNQILPSELDSSFLWFSQEEITAYLLFWLLARILGSDDPINFPCATRLAAILDGEAVSGSGAELLATEVHLSWDEELFRLERAPRPRSGHAGPPSLPEGRMPFQKALGLAGLEPGDDSLARVAEFLLREFDPAGPRPDSLGFRWLPMYETLRWQAQPELATLIDRAEDVPGAGEERGHRLLTLVIRSLGSGLLASRRESPVTWHDLLRRLPRNSVFPFAHVLAQWARKPVHRYFIFPIWESVVDNRSRPAIFAHVFSSRPGHERQEVKAEGRYLLEQLLLFGRFIAQSYYDRQLQEIQTQRQIAAAAYNIGHPLKRRADMLRASLNSLLDLGDGTGRIEPGRLSAKVRSVGEQARRVSNLGHILDVLSDRLTRSTQAGIFGRKAEWRSSEPYLLANCISHLQAIPLRGFSRVKIREIPNGTLDDCVITCWMEGEVGHGFRPADMFYDEMLFEALTNAAKHGASAGGVVEVDCGVENLATDGRDRPALLFRNRCARAPSSSQSPTSSATWVPWKINGQSAVGGLFFIANLLTELGLGAVWTRLEPFDEGWNFVLALSLNGLIRGTMR